MATLTAEQRAEVRADLWSEFSGDRTAINLTKAEGQAAVDAIDDWIDANTASFNAAIPLPARTELTTKLKLRVFREVMLARWGAL